LHCGKQDAPARNYESLGAALNKRAETVGLRLATPNESVALPSLILDVVADGGVSVNMAGADMNRAFLALTGVCQKSAQKLHQKGESLRLTLL
jgi:hypothetical protein